MIKDDQFRDNPANPAYTPGSPSSHRALVYNANRPEVHDLVAEDAARGGRAYANRVLISRISADSAIDGVLRQGLGRSQCRR